MSIGNNNKNDIMLTFIDGKNNNNEGMVRGKNSSDVGRFTIGRQQWKTGRQGRSTKMMTWKDQKHNNEFPMTVISESKQEERKDGGQILGVRCERRVRPSLDLGEPAHSIKC
jgi:hypothetical protein